MPFTVGICRDCLRFHCSACWVLGAVFGVQVITIAGVGSLLSEASQKLKKNPQTERLKTGLDIFFKDIFT